MTREIKKGTKGKICLAPLYFVTTSMYDTMDLCCLEFVVVIFSIFISSVMTVLTTASTLDFSVISNQSTISTSFLKVVRFHNMHVILGVAFSPMVGMDGTFISDSTLCALMVIIAVLARNPEG